MERIYLGGSKASEIMLIIAILFLNLVGFYSDYAYDKCYGLLSTIILSLIILAISLKIGIMAVYDAEIAKRLFQEEEK